VKKKPKPRTRKPGAETDYEIARDELRANGPRARWALDQLELMAKGESQYGVLPPALTIVCIKEILAYEGLPKALRFKAAEGISGDTSITIQVANWAANKPAMPALPAPDETIILPSADGRSTIIEADSPRTNGSLPSSTLSDRERLRAQVLAQRETVVVEAPVSPSEQPHVIGRASQGKPHELTTEEKIRIMETLKRGLPQ
jgi:hypothetical protein